ncbi:PD-(D/E)XK nuclease family protein [Novilysobacter selenitireducens]|uniref:PD-(D/E)XK nuclease family protein n=1 Tax=Novilysobacter selenitireducens TaxID=2872639 RepID=A0ABS7T728_9GAMM|nr:PD-(D/E)XK nuclease family protein [Lysobacter selenitireducens]MBZ4039648.1 PD-(D/E)XK nuclease family protein [Lysobacter selenitireducens]
MADDPPPSLTRPRIAGVCECDIDLLLLEEFLSSPAFGLWFGQAAGVKDDALGTVVEAGRSITHSTGESDLEVHMVCGTGRTVLLIENKIGAGLQPLQAERYHLRGRDYLSKNRCERVVSVIVAPDRYFASSGETKGFECRVSYEALMQWFDNDAAELGVRRYYKRSLLQSGIDKAVLGYQPDVDSGVTEFFRAYWDLAVASYPELGMRPPRQRPGGSGRVYFKTPPLTAIGADIAHKTGRGIVDLHLRGRGARLAEVEAHLGEVLAADMRVASAGKSAAVRLEAPRLDRTAPAAEQLDAIRRGLYAAKRLHDWALCHQERISRI